MPRRRRTLDGGGVIIAPYPYPGARWRSAMDHGSRMRLYLVDLPEGSSMRILAIAIVAPQPSFGSVVEAAAPVIDSIGLHAP